jgi:hypothetical protein
MCFSTGIATLFGLSFLSCNALSVPGPDPSTDTVAVPVSMKESRAAYRISCPRATASCLSRAEAICGGRYRLVHPAGRAPRVQALVDLKVTVVDTDNPYEITVACE